MDQENKKTVLSPEQEARIKNHQTNLISYTAVTLFGILMAAVLIPGFVKLKKMQTLVRKNFLTLWQESSLFWVQPA
ncbi:hypothetical protein [Pseudoflavonifractor sp. 60]|uniref:hypothetical protein n=1 Tax=Pseudoflavonifractor sp. 60 TaxID=2304576 RepID=UPI001371A123|nr:hypothetical protein [Pseudoflavonifractor sp. 60]